MLPLLAVVGETASGKSALALRLAEQFNGELICADSWTVRRQLNIGTAKPTTEEQASVPHHLLDVVDPDEDFTAAVFKRLALEAITNISARGKLPILVGGTGLYIDGVLYDYSFLPPAEPGVREALNALTIPELLARIDAAGIDLGQADIRNKRRLIRLLETGGSEQHKHPLRSNTLIIGLQPDRDLLKERIIARVDTMLNQGLEQEVAALSKAYGWDTEGLKGIGYREWRDYFLGSQTLAQTRERIISSTVGLAKRQRTWFKRNKSIHWFTTPVDYAHVDDLVTTFFNN
jgi:tRNA dimethylallyltransferase